MPPREPVWELEQHTKGKHIVLRRYLDAWLPIVGSKYPKVVLIDGFAGPGTYSGGEKGSPLIMLDALLEHTHRARITAKVGFIFIEKRQDRAGLLREVVAGIKTPPTVDVAAGQGDFADVMSKVLDGLGNRKPPPTFVFIDPFGYRDTRFDVTSRIVAYPHCEVLIFLPTPFVARFVTEPENEEALTNLFDGDEWIAARAIPDLDGRQHFLHGLFLKKLSERARFVRSFEIHSTGASGYHLFFATNNELGLEKMKEAMWSADPVAGERFSDSTVPGQAVLFDPAADLGVLKAALRSRFGTMPFSIEEAETFTLHATAFLPGRHLKSKTLRPAERTKELDVVAGPGDRRRGTYPPGTTVRFAW